MRRAYEVWKPGADALTVIRTADAICDEYGAQGYDLTLRQLYYQFVARDLIANNQRSYKRLGDIVNKARLAGLLNWSYIVDRTRNLRGTAHWSSPAAVVDAAASSYRIDKWADQDVRVEVWVEKEALAGIVQRAADAWDLNWFSCRGYVSQSELWAAARRHLRYVSNRQRVVVLHLGDHDPSGIDMTRDIQDRLQRFITVDYAVDVTPHLRDTYDSSLRDVLDHMHNRVGGEPLTVKRIALNYDQVLQYEPPPNPAKLTDSRASGYVDRHGFESWELDALDPTVLGGLIEEQVRALYDAQRYEASVAVEREERAGLADLADHYAEVREYLDAR